MDGLYLSSLTKKKYRPVNILPKVIFIPESYRRHALRSGSAVDISVWVEPQEVYFPIAIFDMVPFSTTAQYGSASI